jgi:quinoprotein glucose dehydrogenase
LWDYDLPSPPNLITIKSGNKTIDPVAQVTKQGFIFLFDKGTGKPIFPIAERAVTKSKMPDEQSWTTQPFPTKPLPLSRQKIDETMITDISPEAHDYVLKEAKKMCLGDIYLPPGTEGTIQFPGMRGGAEWSGAAFDFETGIMYAGINDIPNLVQMVEQKRNIPDGKNQKGKDAVPPLWNIEDRLKSNEVMKMLGKSRGLMPSFNSLPEKDKDAIIAFLFESRENKLYPDDNHESKSIIERDTTKRYSLKGYTQLKDQNGTLNAVNLNTGELVWKIPLGEFPELAKMGLPKTGTQLFGGCMVTAGGLVFIGASQDEKFRAIEKTTGVIIWKYQLPPGGYATPATYEINGR